jgi:exopolysaccharide biosynthesis polyprenyl glycosylphosphotransferase
MALTVVCFLLALYLRTTVFRNLPGFAKELYPLQTYLPTLLAIVVIWALLGYVLGNYRKVEIKNAWQVLWDQARLVASGVIVLEAWLYLAKTDVSRSLILLFFLLNVMVLSSGRLALFFFKGRLRELLGRYHHVLIVGAGPVAAEMAQYIENADNLGIRLTGFVSPQPSMEPDQSGLKERYQVISLDEARTFLHNHVVDEVLLSLDRYDLDRLAPFLAECEEEGVRTRLHLSFLPATTSRVSLEYLHEIPLVTLSATPDEEVPLLLKRWLDFAIALAMLILLSPLMLLIAISIVLTSPGPVFYRQTRSGMAGRVFTLYKFRSMRQDAEQLRSSLEHLNEADGPVFKVANDPRITGVGRWLRRFSLDELPQLWNVVRGDMSLVGPRPPLPDEVRQYEPWQRRRLRMRPGLTCLWVLEGRSQVSFEQWMRLDMRYIDRWSLWLDLEILLKTVPRVLFGKGAY